MAVKTTLAGCALISAVLGGGLGLRAPAQSPGASTTQADGGLPTFHRDAAWPPKLPNGWVMGQMSGVAVDRRDHVWLLHRPRFLPEDQKSHAAPPVLEFDASGRFVRGWGGPGQGYEWPENEHGIYVDDKDVVWIGGQAGTGAGVVKFRMVGGRKVPVDDDMLLTFTTEGKFQRQIGRQNQSAGNSDTKNLKEPADLVINGRTNEVFVADGYGNSRVIVLDRDTGAFKRMWGAFGNVPVDAKPAPLRPGITGLAMVATESPAPAPPARGNAASQPAPPPKTPPGPQQFGDPVHSVRVSNDALVYVADRTNSRVQVFTVDGKYVNQLFTGGSPGGLALSPDPAQQFLYVGDGARILVVRRKTLEILSQDTFGKRGSVSTHLLAIDSKGNIYTTELDRGTQRFVFDGPSANRRIQ